VTDHAYTHELLREGEWTTDRRMLSDGSISWWEQIPIIYQGAILGALGNIRREGNRVYGDTDLEIPEDAVLTAEVDNLAVSSDDSGGMVIASGRLVSANVSPKGSYPWENEEEGGEEHAS
jgi:hypothetical protein